MIFEEVHAEQGQKEIKNKSLICKNTQAQFKDSYSSGVRVGCLQIKR